MLAKRIHFTGGPGSGKTTAAKLLAARLALPHYDWDAVAIEIDRSLPRPLDADLLLSRVRQKVAEVVRQDGWISDGAYLGWTTPLFEAADLIVRMDVHWRSASYRILTRHLKAELSRKNRFPGWRNLHRFWRWSGRYYSGRNPAGLNVWGTPETKATMLELIEPYAGKTAVCRDLSQVMALVDRMENEPSWP